MVINDVHKCEAVDYAHSQTSIECQETYDYVAGKLMKNWYLRKGGMQEMIQYCPHCGKKLDKE